MKYCLNYNRTTQQMKCIQEADEWTIEYNSKDNTLLEFLELHQNIRINLYIKELLDLKFLEDLCNKYKNLYLKLSKEYYEKLKENKVDIRFYFDILATDWDTFIGCINFGVSDIYIAENLGFELDKVAAIAHSKDIKLRAFPDVAQSKWKDSDSLKKFFIRPEDIDFYSDYIDVIEFYNDDKKLEIYYKIYAKDKKWFGKLNEIILDFNSELDNKYIIPRFPEKRVSCGKSCLKGGHCRRCDRIEQLSNTLEERKLVIKIDKN